MKNLILLTVIFFFTLTVSAQDKMTACGNCNEVYLKSKVYGGTNSFVLDGTRYVFYKFYTTNSRRCYSSGKVLSDVVSTFEDALKNNSKYMALAEKKASKSSYYKSQKGKLVGDIIFKKGVEGAFDEFKQKAKWARTEIEFIEVDADIKSIFDAYPLCSK